MIKLIIICIAFVVVGYFAVSPILKAKLAILENTYSEKSLRKFYLWTIIGLAVFEVLFVFGAALWCGLDDMFKNQYFTIVVSSISVPISISIIWYLKKVIKNKSLFEFLDLVICFVVILLVYQVLPYLGFAPID